MPCKPRLDLQRVVQRRVLRYFRTQGLLDEADANGMLTWQGSGGFSIDASVRIEGEDRAGIERLLRYHGVLAPNAKLRAAVVAIGRPDVEAPEAEATDPVPPHAAPGEDAPAPPANRARIRWAVLLARIYLDPSGGSVSPPLSRLQRRDARSSPFSPILPSYRASSCISTCTICPHLSHPHGDRRKETSSSIRHRSSIPRRWILNLTSCSINRCPMSSRTEAADETKLVYHSPRPAQPPLRFRCPSTHSRDPSHHPSTSSTTHAPLSLGLHSNTRGAHSPGNSLATPRLGSLAFGAFKIPIPSNTTWRRTSLRPPRPAPWAMAFPFGWRRNSEPT